MLSQEVGRVDGELVAWIWENGSRMGLCLQAGMTRRLGFSFGVV
jgi:hypothetical protein